MDLLLKPINRLENATFRVLGSGVFGLTAVPAWVLRRGPVQGLAARGLGPR